MRNVFSAILFAVIFIGLGALVFASAPLGDNVAVQPEAPEVADTAAEVVAGAPAAATAAGEWNHITYVLDSGFTMTSDLYNDINVTTGVTATKIAYYTTGGFNTYDPSNPFSPNDFAISVGDPLFVLAEGSTLDTYTIVGNVPDQGSITFNLDHNPGDACTWNTISLPLDQGSMTMASDILNDIGYPGFATKVAQYTSGGLNTHDPSNPFSPNDFAVKIGYPYFVCVSADTTWPVYP